MVQPGQHKDICTLKTDIIVEIIDINVEFMKMSVMNELYFYPEHGKITLVKE